MPWIELFIKGGNEGHMQDGGRQKTEADESEYLNPGRPEGPLIKKDQKKTGTEAEEKERPLSIFNGRGVKDKGTDAYDQYPNQPWDSENHCNTG